MTQEPEAQSAEPTVREAAQHFEGDGTHYGGDDIAAQIRSLITADKREGE